MPTECYDGKLWHTLSRMRGMHDELSHGIHQPETLGQYQSELNRIKKICEQNQGEYKQTQRSVRDYDMATPLNVCGTYNQYIMHTCEFGTKNNNGMKCHKLFGQKVGNDIEVSYSYSAAARAAGAEKSGKNYDACEFAYSPPRK